MENHEIIVPTSPIELISGGVLYKDIPKELNYSYMVTEDEELLYSDKFVQSGDVFNKLVETKLKEKINVADLLVGDFNQILLALRISGYGEFYTVNIVDPDTGELIKQDVDLSKLEKKPLTAEFNEDGLFNFKLPITGKNITFALPTVGIGDKINQVAVQRKGIAGVDSFITTKLEYLIQSIDGVKDKLFIYNFAKKMPPRDRLAFMKYMDSIEPNVILEADFKTSTSQETKRLKFSLGLDFFYVN